MEDELISVIKKIGNPMKENDMNLFDYIKKSIWESFPDPKFDPEEEKKLKQADKVWRKVIMIIDCLHHNIFMHTNGDKECLYCHKIWKKKGE